MRDEIPKILLGLQHLYSTFEIREKVFDILQEEISGKVDMDVWLILVLATILTGVEFDYDHIREIANNHKNVHEMLRHSLVDDDVINMD